MAEGNFSFKPEALGHLLSDRWLGVPTYHRAYAWNEENVKEFWSDIAAARSDNRTYFLGAIVVTRVDHRSQVIDGQQRLVTASLLFAAIRDQLRILEEENLAGYVEQHYLKSFSPDEGKPSLHLITSAADVGFYESRFVDRSGGEATTVSQKRMVTAFEYLRGRIGELCADQSPADAIEEIKEWLKHLDNSVLVILVETQSDADAFQIFETLNDRGVPLTISDLLKNYLMSLAPDSTMLIQDNWDQALEELGSGLSNSEIVTFIRHFWSSMYGSTRERDLYRSLRRSIVDGGKALEFSDHLRQSSELYAAVSSPISPFWMDDEPSARRSIETLNYFQLEQYRPLLLAAMETFDHSETVKLVRSLVTWSFRGLLVGGIGGGVTERAYAQAALRIRAGGVRRTHEVFDQLRPIIPSDADFESSFRDAVVSRTRVSFYVMRSIERYLVGDSYPELEGDPEGISSLVVLRVLPRDATTDQWPYFSQDISSRYSARLGNYALRQPGKHSLFASWPERRTEISQLGPQLNRQIAQYDEWTPNTVRHRQTELAELALQIWKRSVK